MARRLLAAGFPVAVYNRNPDRSAALAAAGARVAATPREAAQDADLVISMVADDVASRAVWFGVNGALAGAACGAVLVECSTLTVAWVKELAAAVTAAGATLIDAPVTGSKGAAASGELNFLVGGAADAVERLQPVLRAMGRSVTHLGPVGSGALVKLVNNFMAGVHVVAFAEALTWLERSGVDRTQALALLLEGAAASPIAKVMASRMTANDFTPNFLLRLMAKDVGYAIEEAKTRAVDLATAAAALGVFQQAITAGDGDKDMAAVVETLRAQR